MFLCLLQPSLWQVGCTAETEVQARRESTLSVQDAYNGCRLLGSRKRLANTRRLAHQPSTCKTRCQLPASFFSFIFSQQRCEVSLFLCHTRMYFPLSFVVFRSSSSPQAPVSCRIA